MRPRLSCNSNLLADRPLTDAIRFLADAGYQGVDINAETAPPIFPAPCPHLQPDASTAERREVKRTSEQTGVALVSMNAHCSLVHPAGEKRQANVEFVREILALAAEIGCGYVVVGGGRKEFYGWDADYWGRLVQSLRELLEAAAGNGATLAVEAGSQPGALLFGTARVRKLFSTEGLETLRLVFDSAHFHIRGENVPGAFETLSGHVGHVHLKDARGHVEDYSCPPLGMGDVDFRGLARSMERTGYSGFCAVEHEAFAWGHPSEPGRVLADSRAFLESAFRSQGAAV